MTTEIPMDQEINPQSAPSKKSDWPERATNLVIEVTDSIREKGISPIYRIVRVLIFGLLGAALASTVAILLLIGIIRAMTVYLFGDNVWITYLVLGVIFSAAGFFIWSKRIKALND